MVKNAQPPFALIDFLFYQCSINDQYKKDPWGNSFMWGAGNNPSDPYDLTPPSYVFSSADRRYHKFFSKGPGGETANLSTDDKSKDDIVY